MYLITAVIIFVFRELRISYILPFYEEKLYSCQFYLMHGKMIQNGLKMTASQAFL